MAVRKLSGTCVPATSDDRPSRLVTAPLSELLAEANATIFDSAIDEHTFQGGVVRPESGPAIVVIPKRHSAQVRNTMARMLVGQILGTPMIALPASLEARSYGGAL